MAVWGGPCAGRGAYKLCGEKVGGHALDLEVRPSPLLTCVARRLLSSLVACEPERCVSRMVSVAFVLVFGSVLTVVLCSCVEREL